MAPPAVAPFPVAPTKKAPLLLVEGNPLGIAIGRRNKGISSSRVSSSRSCATTGLDARGKRSAESEGQSAECVAVIVIGLSSVS